MKYILFLWGALSAHSLFAQTSAHTIRQTLQWESAARRYNTPGGETIELWAFEGSGQSREMGALPVYTERFPLSGPALVTAEWSEAQYEPIALRPGRDAARITDQAQVRVSVEQERNRFWGRVRIMPIRKNGQMYEKLTSFTLTVRIEAKTGGVAERGGGPFTETSALSAGEIYKFGVSQSGLYKLDINYLRNELGIANIGSIDPRKIKIYGNGGAMLPELNGAERPDDVIENAVWISGEEDGRFDNSDFILFYAAGPSPWSYRKHAGEPQLNVRKHLYDNHAWYFLKIDAGENGLRVKEQPSAAGGVVSEQFDDVIRIEDETSNLLDVSESAQGSGKRWFGDYYFQKRRGTYTFQFPNIVKETPARMKAEFAARSSSTTTVQFVADGNSFSRNVPGVNVSNNEYDYADDAVVVGSFSPKSDQIEVQLNYNETAQRSEGWLDYIEINARRRLLMSGKTMEFRDIESLDDAVTRFRLGGVNGALTVWDITRPQSAARIVTENNGATVEFGAATRDVLKNFIAFYADAEFLKPEAKVGKIANQNLHALKNLHMAIVYHPEMEAAAKSLAEHRRAYSGIDVQTANMEQIYNEFSSGAKDPTAIRDFARMLYERNPEKFEFLLLFGDGSFDPKNNSKGLENPDFIPVFETAESFDPVHSHPSDDYFALLSPNEGGALDGSLDVAVGRIPARSQAEAQTVVDKIVAYDQSPATLGDWRQRLLFIADDEDGNAHLSQAEKLSSEAEKTEKWFNIEKIYFDAYEQEASSSEKRIPDAKAAINANIFKGALTVNYIGHGGPKGWAQERVVDNNDIAGWENADRLPLFITATCSFGGYDDYKTLTGGEQALLKPNSGAIGLFTTVRAVFIFGNDRLTDAVQEVIFSRKDGRYRSVGDILKDGKNTLSGGDEDNARRFTLLGDPSMFLALPDYRVRTTLVNNKPFDPAKPDTLRALMPASIAGEVVDVDGNLLSSFNGRVFITIYDKKQTLQTLGQDQDSPVRPFSVQRNIIFRGQAKVSGGKFSSSFVVPKDINYAYGIGKISYYAENGTPLDAAGADEGLVIGGSANLIKDDKGPLVQPFLNTDAFVSGGITNDEPKILIKCQDDYGMNVSGSSLGHDLVAILDDNVQETIVLNDFYQSELDNAKKGQAIYPLRNLAPGKHTLRVKGWDVANNPGEGYTEFIVAQDGAAALSHVLNYPNPFTTRTNFQFEHNLAGQTLDVQISIFSISGKLVKTILHNTLAAGFRVTDIEWDGRDEYGDRLAKGVYLYRVKVRGADVSGTQTTMESDFEKLVILK